MENYPEIIVKHSGYVELPRIVDDRDGALCIAEFGRQLPFEPRRLYYITNLESGSSIRGKHAHRRLRQVIFCLSGCFTLSLDDGRNKQDILMWRDNVGVVLGPGLWHTMHSFSGGCVLLVLADDYYDESDYIRSYDEFLKWTGGEG